MRLVEAFGLYYGKRLPRGRRVLTSVGFLDNIEMLMGTGRYSGYGEIPLNSRHAT